MIHRINKRTVTKGIIRELCSIAFAPMFGEGYGVLKINHKLSAMKLLIGMLKAPIFDEYPGKPGDDEYYDDDMDDDDDEEVP